MMKCDLIDLGLADFGAAENVQRRLLEEIYAGKREGALIIAEFKPVYTLGRSGSMGNLLVSAEFLKENGIGCYNINRGGDITVHSPGQLVAYPLLNLAKLKKDLNWYLRSLEDVIIGTLSGYRIPAHRRPGLTGAWVGDRKIAFIGISVSKWVTSHGLSININNNLSFFDFMNPCGIKNCVITSVSKIKGKPADMGGVKKLFLSRFKREFKIAFSREAVLA